MKRVFLILCLCFLNYYDFAQQVLPPGIYTSKIRKAIKRFEAGKRCFDARNDKEAERFMHEALEVDPQFAEAHILISVLCREQKRYAEELQALKSALALAPELYIENYFRLAELELSDAQYASAQLHYTKFLSYRGISAADRSESQFKLQCIAFALEAIKHPVPVEFKNCGAEWNSDLNEYFPSFTSNEFEFIFTRRLNCAACYNPYQEDIFISQRNRFGQWTEARKIQELSSTGNEGAPSISADGQYMFITVSQEMDGLYMGGKSKGYGSCDIFFTKRQNGVWSRPTNLGPAINTPAWESQPCFSSDGKTLYFLRGKPQRNGSVREVDIYESHLNAEGQFTEAQKLPSPINTDRDEQSVFIHPDNQTLYFSSKGHPGMGGFDIFLSRKQPDGSWSQPQNLGFPINTSKDENSMIIAPSGNEAYFASDREGGLGGLDIYRFNLPELLKPQKITYVSGRVFNAKTSEPLAADLALTALETQINAAQLQSDINGQFLVTLTAGHDYGIQVKKPGYLFYSAHFSLKDQPADFKNPFIIQVPLVPIDTGSRVALRNIFFDVNQAVLKPESKAELWVLIAFLKTNPNVEIEIGGHTDNVGDKAANITLSENRAKAVYQFLITEGNIASSRLKYKGYGEQKPLVLNDNDSHRAENRRTEFKITKSK